MVHFDIEDLKLSKNPQLISDIERITASVYHKAPRFIFRNSYPEHIKTAFTTPENIQISKVKQIEKIVVETPTIKTFLFRYPEIARMAQPGQFILVNVFKKFDVFKYLPDEFPESLSHIDRNKGLIGITVARVGEGTKALHKHEKDDIVGLRGPYGQGFRFGKMGNDILVIGGGVGMAPLAPLVRQLKKEGKNVTVLIGAQTKEELLFSARIRELGLDPKIATDDGSEGWHGHITDFLEELLKKGARFSNIIACGPESMIKNTLSIANNYEIQLQASLERYMKCGRGICGHCSINGFQVCQDGPVFSSNKLNTLGDFGMYVKDAYGRKRPLLSVK